jgi:hypothetical protein
MSASENIFTETCHFRDLSHKGGHLKRPPLLKAMAHKTNETLTHQSCLSLRPSTMRCLSDAKR